MPQSPNLSGLPKVTVAPLGEVAATVMLFGHSRLQVGGVPPPPSPIVIRPELAVLSTSLRSVVSLDTLTVFAMVDPGAPVAV